MTREEVLDQLETERKAAWAWYWNMGDLQAHDDHYGYFQVQCLVEYYEPDELWPTYESMLGYLMKDALEERNFGMMHGIDIAGQLC